MNSELPNLDRLSRIEAMLERIVNIQGNQQDSINKLIEGQLFSQVLQGRLAEQSLQLKRAVDYLLSNDSENKQD